LANTFTIDINLSGSATETVDIDVTESQTEIIDIDVSQISTETARLTQEVADRHVMKMVLTNDPTEANTIKTSSTARDQIIYYGEGDVGDSGEAFVLTLTKTDTEAAVGQYVANPAINKFVFFAYPISETITDIGIGAFDNDETSLDSGFVEIHSSLSVAGVNCRVLRSVQASLGASIIKVV